MSDAELILEWQRDPRTRRFANNPKTPESSEHNAWMEKKISSLMDLFWIILHDGVPAGILRLDYQQDEQGYLVSIFVIPDKYRLGIASAALTIAKRVCEGSKIYAQVLEGNFASISLFKSAGFSKIGNDLFVWESSLSQGVSPDGKS